MNVTDQGVILGHVEVPERPRAAGLVGRELKLEFSSSFLGSHVRMVKNINFKIDL